MKQADETKPGNARLFAIGDIHGCSTALQKLIESIDPHPQDTIVILGDFIDCGPDSKGVIDRLLELSGRCQMIPLLGNHEEMLLSILDDNSDPRYWLDLGGRETLNSYSPDSTTLDVIPDAHIQFIRACRDFHETDTHIFVHANYDPNRPMNWLGATKLRWEHLDLAALKPHYTGKTVVVGHTPQPNGKVLDLGFLIGIDTDCCRGGWLTASPNGSTSVMQANENSMLRMMRLTNLPYTT